MTGSRGLNTYSLSEIFEQWHVTPSFHVRSLELADLLEFRLLRVLVQCREQALVDNEVFVAVLVIDLDVLEVRMYADRKIGG